MTHEEVKEKIRALTEKLGGRLCVLGHDTHYVEIDAEYVLIIERVERLACVSFAASLADTCRTIGSSGKVETWSEIETWIRGVVNSIRSEQ